MSQEPTGKQKIRRAALALFATQDHRGVSLREIARHADVSVSLVVHYFKTKRGIARAVDEGVVADARAVAEHVLSTRAARPVRDVAMHVGDALFQAFAEPPEVRTYVRRALLNESAEIHDGLGVRITALTEELVARLVPARVRAMQEACAGHMLVMILGHLVLDGIVPGRSADPASARKGCRSGLRAVLRELSNLPPEPQG